MAPSPSDRMTFVTPKGRLLAFTRLGFGTAPIGNYNRVLTDAEAEGVGEGAWDAGLRHFDTAPLYGHGLAEQRLGRALRGKPRDDYLLSTKVGRRLEACAPGEETPGIFLNVPPVRWRYDYSYDAVMRGFEESLGRMGLDRADILYVHDVDARNQGGRDGADARLRELMDQGGWRALDDLRASGAVAAIGVGVNEWEPCARMLELADPDIFLLAGRYTLLEQAPLDGFFPDCRRRGVGVVIGGPLNSGILARGAHGGGTFDYGQAPPAVIARVEALDAVCRRFQVPLVAAALQFPSAHPVVVSVIPGPQIVAELNANLASLATPIPGALWATLRDEGLLHPDAPTPAAA